MQWKRRKCHWGLTGCWFGSILCHCKPHWWLCLYLRSTISNQYSRHRDRGRRPSAGSVDMPLSCNRWEWTCCGRRRSCTLHWHRSFWMVSWSWCSPRRSRCSTPNLLEPSRETGRAAARSRSSRCRLCRGKLWGSCHLSGRMWWRIQLCSNLARCRRDTGQALGRTCPSSLRFLHSSLLMQLLQVSAASEELLLLVFSSDGRNQTEI